MLIERKGAKRFAIQLQSIDSMLSIDIQLKLCLCHQQGARNELRVLQEGLFYQITLGVVTLSIYPVVCIRRSTICFTLNFLMDD
jgi:hypothetical protein